MENKKRLSKAERKRTVRYLAMQTLVAIEQDAAYSNLALTHALQQTTLNKLDENLFTELVYGVTQRRLTLDTILNVYIKKNVPLWVRSLLRLSAFQLLYLDRIPEHAILNEAAEITKLKAGQGLVNFVNGVLRNVTRHGKAQLEALASAPLSIETIVQRTSLPEWLVRYFAKTYTLAEVDNLAQSLLERPHLSVRVQLDSKEQIKEALAVEGYTVTDSPLTDVGLRVKGGNIAFSDLFQQGMLTIQDESSMLVAPSAQLHEDMLVLDACAAPGGKTTHIASLLTTGHVVALDLYEHKLDLIQENADRLHVADRIQVKQLDARDVTTVFGKDYFDCAYIDAPCSGLGLMRRKPDIKYTKDEQTIEELAAIQFEILEQVSQTVKKGGQIIYSTCTITVEENIGNIKRFLDKYPQYSLKPLTHLSLPEQCYTPEGAVQILPNMYGTDGFFIACLEKLN